MKFPGSLILLSVFIFSFLPATGQFYSTGEPPSSIRWMQIITPRYRVVFPRDLQSQGIQLVHDLESTRSLTSRPYSRPAKVMPILLYSASVLSNGFVTWTPLRMELVTTPPQDSYAQDWIGQLSLHEYRHVVQLSQLSQGFTSFLSVLTGEIAPGSISSMIPRWFFEGDAVENETENSQTGRGRVPGFEMPLRTMILGHNRLFSYDKAFFGSYRDFVPDLYQYGYQMVSFSKVRYGSQIWDGALTYTARNPYMIWPLAFYLKKNYGIYKQGLYKETMDSLHILYDRQEKSIAYSKYLILNRRRTRDFTSYKLPHDMGGGNVLVLKSGLGFRDHFVMIDSSGRERNVITPGSESGLESDLSGNLLIWDENTADPRWEQRSFSEIRLYNLKTGKLKNLTKRTRYFSPDFSPDGKRIAVVETDLQENHFLSVINAETGDPVLRIPSDENRALQFPEWISGTKLVVITVSPKGKQIEELDLTGGQWKVILPNTLFDVSEPMHFHKYILFRSSFNNLENIYALDPDKGKIFQVTHSRFGAFNPTVTRDSASLLFSAYTDQGYDICQAPLDPAAWKEITIPHAPSGIWPSTVPEMSKAIETVVPDTGLQWKPRPYNKSLHLLHFHSWLPFYTTETGITQSVGDVPLQVGFMLFSQNLLSTFISTIGYHYSGGYNYLTPRISWKGWYPVFELTGQLGGHVQSVPLPEGISVPNRGGPYLEYAIRSYVPLVFNRGRYITYLQPQVEYEHTSLYYFAGGWLRKGMDYIHYSLYLSHNLRMSLRDLYPRFGQYFYSTFTQTPADVGLLGSLFSVKGGAYFPGIFAHQHLVIKAGYQKQYPEKYFLSINRMNFPRGYPSAISGEFSTFSVDYAFPFAYPDLSAGPLLYLKRLRADLFHDESYGTSIIEKGGNRFTGSYRSTGLEVLADFHLARIIFPISAGVRTGYLHDRNRFFSEFLINIQTSSL